MSDTTLLVSDASAASQILSCSQDAGNSNAKVPKTNLVDPVSGVDHLIREDGAAYVSGEGKRATYRAAVCAVTPIATPTAMITIQGSATKTIAITHIAITGAATAAGSMQVSLNRRSSAGTDGSAARDHLTLVPLESSDSAATAVVDKIKTANQGTPGTLVGLLGARRLNLVAAGSAATSGEGKPEIWTFGAARGTKPLILSGIAEFVTIDGEASTVPTGGVFDFEVEFQEY